jgi:hypothetical protein
VQQALEKPSPQTLFGNAPPTVEVADETGRYFTGNTFVNVTSGIT